MANGVCPICQTEMAAGTAVCMGCGFNAIEGAPLPGWVREGVDLRTVARRQRLLLWLVLGLLALQVFLRTQSFSNPLMFPLLVVILFATMIGVAVTVVTLMVALRRHVIVCVLYTILMFAPCVNLIILLVINQQATAVLRKAGLRVGLMGVKDEQVVRLLGLYCCRKCSYSLIGNVSGVCPECGTPVGTGPHGPGPTVPARPAP